MGTTFAGTLMSAPGLCGPTLYPNCAVIIALAPIINITVLFADVFADHLHTSEIDGTAAPNALFFSHQGTGYTLLLHKGGVIKAEEIASTVLKAVTEDS
jgi:hypothetical protein